MRSSHACARIGSPARACAETIVEKVTRFGSNPALTSVLKTASASSGRCALAYAESIVLYETRSGLAMGQSAAACSSKAPRTLRAPSASAAFAYAASTELNATVSGST